MKDGRTRNKSTQANLFGKAEQLSDVQGLCKDRGSWCEGLGIATKIEGRWLGTLLLTALHLLDSIRPGGKTPIL